MKPVKILGRAGNASIVIHIIDGVPHAHVDLRRVQVRGEVIATGNGSYLISGWDIR